MKIKLVHSVNELGRSKDARNEWGLQNPRQLTLFEDETRDTLHIAAMNELNSHFFKRYFRDSLPASILDIRPFPDFFYFYSSIYVALDDFRDNNVEYRHFPMDNNTNKNKFSWDARLSFVKALDNVKQSHQFLNSVCLVLVSNLADRDTYLSTIESIPDVSRSWRVEVI